MYRKSLDQKMNENTTAAMDIEFLNRMSMLPVVAASLGQLAAIYSQAKDSNRVIKFTLDKAETGVATVASTAVPLVNKFGKPISMVDGFVCGQLDKLEQKYPIINKPTEVWVSEGQNMYVSTVKPSVDKLMAAKEMGKETCSKVYDTTLKSSVERCNKAVRFAGDTGAATYNMMYKMTVQPTIDTVTAAKDLGVNTVQATSHYGKDKVSDIVCYGKGKVENALNTSYGQVLHSKTKYLLHVADDYVDYYLPESQDESAKLELDAVEQETAFTQACTLTSKTRRRMYQRAMKDMHNLKIRTQDAIDSLKHTIDLIQYDKVSQVLSDAKTVTVDGAKFTGGKVKYYWEEMNKTGEEVEMEVSADGSQQERMSMERRMIATARHLTQKIKLGVAALASTASSVMPSRITTSLNEAKKYSHDLYQSFASTNSFQDMGQNVLDQTKDKLDYLTQTLSSAFDYAKNMVNLDWVKKPTNEESERNENAREPDERTEVVDERELDELLDNGTVDPPMEFDNSTVDSSMEFDNSTEDPGSPIET